MKNSLKSKRPLTEESNKANHSVCSGLNVQNPMKQLITVERTDTTTRTWKLLISVLLFLAVVTVCILYIHRTTVPLDRHEIGPASDPDRWQFTLTDGTELQPQDGRLPLESTDAILMYLDIAILDDDQEDAFGIQKMIFNMQGNWHVDQYAEVRSWLKRWKTARAMICFL